MLGDRLNFIYKDMVQLDRIVPELRRLLVHFKSDRLSSELLGDFCNRKGLDDLLQFEVDIVAQQDERTSKSPLDPSKPR